MQEDSIVATCTPREALHFSASMRLPSTMTEEDITNLVSKLLKSLGLEDCADVMVGGALIKGISGGQRKRTSVGVELITKPSLLFLDEPTSGLDSYQAYSCVKLLQSVASESCTILCTIHQPSSEVAFLFDLMILMRNGRVVYHGPVHNVARHFTSCGYDCPDDYNPADFALFILQTQSSKDLEENGVFMKEPSVTESTKVLHHQTSLSANETDDIFPAVQASFTRQISSIVYREWLNFLRDTGSLIARFGISSFLFLLFGIVFFNAGGKDDSDNVNFNTHFGLIAFLALVGMFQTAQNVLLTFPAERPMFLREYATGTYTAKAYFLGKFLMELVLCLAQVMITLVIVYFMCTLHGDFGYFLLIFWIEALCSNSLAFLLGSLMKDAKDATEVSNILYIPQFLFSGFFIRISLVPVFLRWAQYLCIYKYAVNMLLITEFDLKLKSCQGGAEENCKHVKSTNDVVVDLWWLYMILCISIGLICRALGIVVLIKKAKHVR